MSQTDWAKLYAAMDKRIALKYEQLPKGEQIGKRGKSVQQFNGSKVQTASFNPPPRPRGRT
jgi:hypothetical protein